MQKEDDEKQEEEAPSLDEKVYTGVRGKRGGNGKKYRRKRNWQLPDNGSSNL